MMRFVFPLMAALLLSACAGFEPLHNTQAGQSTLMSVSLDIEEGRDEGDRRASYMLRQRLLDRMAPQEKAAYRLTVTPSLRRVGLGLTGLDRATRYDSVLVARYVLTDAKTGKVIERDSLRTTATFSADRDPYRVVAADEAGTERATRDLADRLISDVALALADHQRKTAP